MPAFMIADVNVTDMQKYANSGYLENTPRISAQYGGRYRARGGEMHALEGGWEPARVIVIEFPSLEKLLAFYNSEEYAPWIKVRQSLSDSKIIAIDGIAGDAIQLET